MREKKYVGVDKAVELFKKAMENPDAVSKDEKKQLKKIMKDTGLVIEAAKILGEFPAGEMPVNSDARTDEEIIAESYVSLAKFTVKQLGLKNVTGLRVQENADGFTVYALTPEPVELEFHKFATSDYPDYEEFLLEAEALQADLFTEDNAEALRGEIKKRIESADITKA